MKQPTVASSDKLMKEWDFERNIDLNPEQITWGSEIMAWWKCEGHSYLQMVNHHAHGSKCPYCCGKQTLPGFNDLATMNPELAAQWNDDKNGSLKPYDVRACSNKKVWWKCDKGHSWRSPINGRNAGNGCPYCSNRKALKGEMIWVPFFRN